MYGDGKPSSSQGTLGALQAGAQRNCSFHRLSRKRWKNGHHSCPRTFEEVKGVIIRSGNGD